MTLKSYSHSLSLFSRRFYFEIMNLIYGATVQARVMILLVSLIFYIISILLF